MRLFFCHYEDKWRCYDVDEGDIYFVNTISPDVKKDFGRYNFTVNEENNKGTNCQMFDIRGELVEFDLRPLNFVDEMTLTRSYLSAGYKVQNAMIYFNLVEYCTPETKDLCTSFKDVEYNICYPITGIPKCPICMVKDESIISVILACGHRIHKECWGKWIRENGIECVLCKTAFCQDEIYIPYIKNETDMIFAKNTKKGEVSRKEGCLNEELFKEKSILGICGCDRCLGIEMNIE